MQVIAIFKLVLILIHCCQFVREMHLLNRETCVLLVKIYWTKMSEMRNILHFRYYKIYGQLTLNAVHRLKFDDWKQFLRYIDTGITTFKPLFILFLMSSVHSVVFFQPVISSIVTDFKRPAMSFYNLNFPIKPICNTIKQDIMIIYAWMPLESNIVITIRLEIILLGISKSCPHPLRISWTRSIVWINFKV